MRIGFNCQLALIFGFRGLFRAAACLLLAGPARAAFISEIDLSSPAGRAIEFSDLDPATDYTLLIIDANAFSPANFGRVRGVVTLPAGIGVTEVVMVSDSVWPGDPGRTTPMSALSPPPDPGTLALDFSRLLVLLEGTHGIARSTDLLPDGGEPPLYDADDVSDWLVLGDGAVGPMYQDNGHDIDQINTTLGIDLLSRLVDKNAGPVIGRTKHPGEAIDLDVFFSGEPDAFGKFPVGPNFNYRYTPGLRNTPIESVGVPEPGAALVLGLGLVLVGCRRI